MLSDKRFQNLQSEYFGRNDEYNRSNENYNKAKLLLISVNEIEETHNILADRYNDERHWFQQKFITRSIDDILSAFLLNSNYFYSSAYRDIRSLYETFLILNHMNDNKIKTAKIFWKQEHDLEDIEVSSAELAWEEFRTEDAFHDMLEIEREHLEDSDREFKQLYNYFSNRYIHPTRIDGVDLQREYDEKEDQQLLEWLLDMTLGLLYQLFKLYSDTEDFRYTVKSLQEIGEKIEERHEPQSFLDVAMENSPIWT